MTEQTETYLGAYALCVDDDGGRRRMLLVRDRGPERWTLPGGGVEAAEHPDDTVHRELGEETGLSGRVGGLVGVYARHHPAQPGSRRPAIDHIGILYEMTDLTGELRHEADGTTDRAEWFTRHEIDALPLGPLAEHGVALVWPA